MSNHLDSNGDDIVTKGKKEPYDGSKQPMVAESMLNSSRSIRNALKRITTRRNWIADQEGKLIELFNSDNATDKSTALQVANKLKSDLPKLKKAEDNLNSKLSKVNAHELEELSKKDFPKFGLSSTSEESSRR